MLACGVFVAAIDLGVVGQRAQLEQRLPHHLGRALDHAAAADREQRVAGEGELVGREQIGDVAGGVARRLDHARCRAPPTATVSPSRTVSSTTGMRAGLGVAARPRGNDALLQLRDAAGVIVVMMGHQDVGELPAGRLQRGLDRRRLGRVDRGGRAACGIVHQHAEIVLEAEKQAGLARAWLIPR